MGYLGSLSQEALGRIFSKCIFLNLLDLLEVPQVVLVMVQTKKLTSVQLGCDYIRFIHSMEPSILEDFAVD